VAWEGYVVVDLLERNSGKSMVSAILAGLVLVGCAASTAPSSAPPPPATASLSPAPSSSSEPSLVPTPAPTDAPQPTAGGSVGARFNVDLSLSTGRTVRIEVKDDSGMLIEATSGIPGDGASVAEGTIDLKNGGANVLTLTWSGPPCATDNFLLIEAGAARMTVVQPMCSGDAIALDRVLVLTLSTPVSSTSVEAILQAGGDTPG
jgi:hypothetical protein